MKTIVFAGIALLAGVMSAVGAEFNACVVNGRMVISTVDTLDGFVVQQMPNGAADWTTVAGFTLVGGYAHGPDQSLAGVSQWRCSTDGGATWTELGRINARYSVRGQSYIGNIGDGQAQTLFDGMWNTFADSYAGGPWGGLDLGKSVMLVGAAFVPRFVGTWPFPDRTKNLSLQVSDDPGFSTYTEVHCQNGTQLENRLYVISFAEPVAARYVRMIGAEYANMAEIEFDYDPQVISLDEIYAERADDMTGRARISWNREASSANGVCVFRREGDALFECVASLEPGVVQYEDADVKLGHTYTYGLAFRDETGEPGEVQPLTVAYTCMRRLERALEDLTKLKSGYSVIYARSSFISIGAASMFDGSTGTFPDMWNDDKPFIGVDFGDVPVYVAECRYYPRSGFTDRVKSMFVCGSTNEMWSTSGNYAAISGKGPSSVSLQWYALPCDSSAAYRYVFMANEDIGWCGNLSEVEFYGWDATDLGIELFAPTDFHAERAAAGAELRWSGCAAAEKYVIEKRAADSDDWTTVAETAETTWSESSAEGMTIGASYVYRVTAVAGVKSKVGQSASIVWYPGGGGTGLLGAYYRNYQFEGWTASTELVAAQVDQTLDFGWGNDTLLPGHGECMDNVRVVWTGSLIVPTDGTYRFKVDADDICQLWIDGVAVAGVNCVAWTSDECTLTAGAHDIRVDYLERASGARMHLSWIGFMGEEIIPSTQLVPAESVETMPEPWLGWRSCNQLYYGGRVSFGEAGEIFMETSGGGLIGETEGYTFLHQAYEGDFVAVCRYTWTSSSDYEPCALLMVRSALERNAPFLAVASKNGTDGVSFGARTRTAAEGEIASDGFAATVANATSGWLRIMRKGNEFSWCAKADGAQAWTMLGEWTDEEGVFGEKVFLGPAGTVDASSSNQRRPSSMTFTDFSIQTPKGLYLLVR